MDLAALTATEQKALLDAGKASCRELLADCRTRAEMTEPVLNAIPTVHWETAEDLASRLDDNPNLLEGTPLRGHRRRPHHPGIVGLQGPCTN